MDNEAATIRPGALFFVLKISQLAGAAPLSFRRLRNGYRISVSRFQLAYNFFVLTAFNAIGLIGIFLNLKDKKSIDFQSPSTTLLIITERMLCIVACSMGYMGAIRMKNIIGHINDLEKIRIKINYGCNSAKEDRNMLWISYFIIITNFVFTLLEMMFTALRASEYSLGVTLLAIHYLQYNILILLKIQIVVINFEVYKILLELNARLHYIVTLADRDDLTTAKARLVDKGVRSITRCYVSVCDVVTKINNDEGLYMFLIYTCFAIFSAFDGYRLILALITPSAQYRLSGIMLQCGWCMLIIVRIPFFVEPFHRVSAQVIEMKVLLTRLLYHNTPLGNHTSLELDIMIKQVILNVPQYCPLGIDTLNRSLITATFNVIITFLVFMVQILIK